MVQSEVAPTLKVKHGVLLGIGPILDVTVAQCLEGNDVLPSAGVSRGVCCMAIPDKRSENCSVVALGIDEQQVADTDLKPFCQGVVSLNRRGHDLQVNLSPIALPDQLVVQLQ